ncbi:MAG: hypothetical protein NWS66_02890, partial [Saprospiraceae bacterium]|nr:hypothetical protein [Saprospiraceae bacterium]
NGLVYRGTAADTVTKPSNYTNKDIKAYLIVDTVNNVMYSYIASKGGWKFNNSDTVIINNVTDTASLSNRINLKLNISDTALMLTNYLRTGVAASTYQTKLTNPVTGTGTLNYLPKFTGTSTLGSSELFRDANRFSYNEGTDQSFGWDFMGNTSNPFIGNNVKTSTNNERVERMASTTLFNPAAIIFGYQRVNNSTGAASFGGMNFMTTSGNLAGDINPITYSRMFIEPDGNIGIGTMQPSYKFDIRGTLGVTGATTLSAPLTVNSSAVFNEGSAIADFRVESDGNINMLFVDGTNNRVGIGTNAPTKTLEVNGEINASGEITANSFKKSGGTFNQFLKGDGTVDGNDYLTTSSAASIYYPKIGGTISGTINRQEGNHDGRASTFYYNVLNYFAKRDNNKGNQTAQITFTDRPGTYNFPNAARTSDIYLMTARNYNNITLGQYLDTTLSVVANQDGGRIGISKLNPAYKLDVNGTLGVSGPSTFLNLQGTGSRMVVAGSGGLLSTQAIPTGTVTSVGGTGTVNGISLTGTVTSSGNLTLGGTLSGVSLSSQVTGTLPIANGGTGATTAATARTALGATVRGSNTFILPDLGAISFLRYNADNTVSQRAADGMRSDLGGSTIGQSMFTLTNPSAITFPRFNA